MYLYASNTLAVFTWTLLIRFLIGIDLFLSCDPKAIYKGGKRTFVSLSRRERESAVM